MSVIQYYLQTEIDLNNQFVNHFKSAQIFHSKKINYFAVAGECILSLHASVDMAKKSMDSILKNIQALHPTETFKVTQSYDTLFFPDEQECYMSDESICDLTLSHNDADIVVISILPFDIEDETVTHSIH